MSTDWPTEHDTLALRREALEHRRAWAIIAGLTNAIEADRRQFTDPSYSPDQRAEHVERIHDLEARVVGQKRALAQLEGCRRFEMETERLLAKALYDVRVYSDDAAKVAHIVQEIITVYEARKGPRPEEG